MNWKRLKKAVSAVALSVAMLAGTAVSASADTTGGIGGGGGPGGAYSGFEWVSVVGNKGEAYDRFVQLSGWGWQTDGLVNSRVSNGVGVCRDSNVIWFIRSAQGGWTYNYTGATHGQWSGNVAGSIEWPWSAYGNRRPTGEEIQRFKDWDAGQNGRRIDNVPGYTIICSGKFIQPDKTWNTWTSNVIFNGQTGSATFTEPYSRTTTIARQDLENAGGKDIVGADNLHSQTSTAVKTKFGELYDSVVTSSGAGWAPGPLQNAVNNAIAADKNSGPPTLDLDDKNKAGMAEGGVLNVSTTSRMATISTVETTRTTRATSCYYRQTWNSYWAAWNAATSSCSSSDTSTVTRTSSKNAPATQKLTGFWQMLSVHCNQAEFDALLKSDSNLIEIQTPDPSNKMSGVVYTKNQDPAASAILLGNPTNPNGGGAKAKTGKLAFYDKECPFDCTPDPAVAGASDANGATKNVGPSGAISDSVNSNSFEFFRDNSPKKIKVDTWFPVSQNGVDYKGEAPVTTTVTRDLAGTPSLDGSGGGKFTMKSVKDASTLFTGSAANVATQKNWDSASFSNSMATILQGLHREFTVQSTWASDAGKPQAFNFKWEYAPSVNTTVPLTSVGFTGINTPKIGTTGDVATKIQGKCYTFFGTKTDQSTVAEFGANTGTGTTNNLDSQLLTGPKSIAKLSTNFVRATAE